MQRKKSLVGAACVLLLTSMGHVGTAGAVPSGSGYAVSSITTPGPANGDVVVAGGALFVGIGGFGVGGQSVVRIDGGGVTTLADGFNSLGGMIYDPVNDRLLTGDNGGEQGGAITGDTLYAIDDPFGSPGSPAAASTLELLPMGSVPGYSDIVLDPTDASGDTAIIGDASGSIPPNGQLLSVILSSGATSVLQSGLAFTAGLATDGSSVFFGESLLDFSGQVSSVPVASATDPAALIAAIALGQYDVELSGDGTLITSAGSQIVRVDPGTGSQTTVASGFGFATGLFEDESGVIYALDGFAPGFEDRVWVLTPVPEPTAALSFAVGLALLAGRRQSASRSEKRTGTATRP